MTILVTGSAGFIGFHTAKRLLEEGETVVGVDNFNDYYDPKLKEGRNVLLEKYENFKLYRGDITDLEFVQSVFSENKIDKVCHLAAQAGIRYSLVNPYTYVNTNIVGFTYIINEAKNAGVKEFVYASSSSVYGDQPTAPFHEEQLTDKPLSIYAATKKADEEIAYVYHHLYGMHCVGLRFFTVYGPYGRPDMAMISFAENISKGIAIRLFNEGKMKRDFTYIDDIVEGVVKALTNIQGHEVINLGNHNPVELLTFVELLEKGLGKSAVKELLPIQPGEAIHTHADISKAQKLLGWEPKVSFEEGVKGFIDWYKEYYG